MKEYIKQAKTITWLTSGQALIWDEGGNQIAELQKEFTPEKQNKALLKSIAENCKSFSISSFREWNHSISKEDFFSLLMLNS